MALPMMAMVMSCAELSADPERKETKENPGRNSQTVPPPSLKHIFFRMSQRVERSCVLAANESAPSESPAPALQSTSSPGEVCQCGWEACLRLCEGGGQGGGWPEAVRHPNQSSTAPADSWIHPHPKPPGPCLQARPRRQRHVPPGHRPSTHPPASQPFALQAPSLVQRGWKGSAEVQLRVRIPSPRRCQAWTGK
jgi:hypothetical protein